MDSASCDDGENESSQCCGYEMTYYIRWFLKYYGDIIIIIIIKNA